MTDTIEAAAEAANTGDYASILRVAPKVIDAYRQRLAKIDELLATKPRYAVLAYSNGLCIKISTHRETYGEPVVVRPEDAHSFAYLESVLRDRGQASAVFRNGEGERARPVDVADLLSAQRGQLLSFIETLKHSLHAAVDGL